MSKSEQRQTGNRVGGDSTQRSNAVETIQTVESSKIVGSLTQESLNAKKENINEVLKQILDSIERLGLKAEDVAELKAHTETAQAQLRARSPKPAIITESLKSIWETLKGAAISSATSGVGMLVKELIDKLSRLLQ